MFLSQEERDAAQILSDALARDGVDIHLNTNAVNVRVEGKQKLVDLVSDDNKRHCHRRSNPGWHWTHPQREGINLEAAGVEYDDVDWSSNQRFPADHELQNLCFR